MIGNPYFNISITSQSYQGKNQELKHVNYVIKIHNTLYEL
jgi:hypothetical protein